MALYRNFMSQSEIDLQYNAVLSVPDLQPYLDYDGDANSRAREELVCYLDVKYGNSPDETMDIFPAKKANAPVFVFIHGGYWRSLHSRDFSLVARGLVKNGITVVIPNYSLCPAVTIADITEQNRAALLWVYQNIKTYHANPEQIIVGGHSAGAQQVGMLLSTRWVEDYGLPENIVKGGIAISGIYDLTPLYYSWLQPSIQLTEESIAQQSPLFQIPLHSLPLLITVGEDETEEFKRQARQYCTAWQQQGHVARLQVQAGKNHFTTYRDFNDPSSELCNDVARLVSGQLIDIAPIIGH